MAGERMSHGSWRRDRHGGAPACKIIIACGFSAAYGCIRQSKAESGVRRRFKGPLTEPQADGSSDRVLPLSLRDGPQSE
jgi:hypothetical protein